MRDSRSAQGRPDSSLSPPCGTLVWFWPVVSLGGNMKKPALVLALALLALAGCSSSTETGDAPSSATATNKAPTTSPRPTTARPSPVTYEVPSATGIPMSGSYAEDIAALGIQPDDVADYTSWMKERICDQDRVGLGVAVRSIGGSEPASGGGQEVVRLTVAYFCPEKSQEVETALDYFN